MAPRTGEPIATTLVAGVATFFLARRLLNRQMVATKERDPAWACQMLVSPRRRQRSERPLAGRNALAFALGQGHSPQSEGQSESLFEKLPRATART